MTEINNLKDELKVKNKILEDNQHEIHKIKDELKDQIKTKDA